MNTTNQVRIIRGKDLCYVDRGGASGGVAETSWAIPENTASPLLAGFGRWHEADGEPKTLDYDEVILILEGTFGIELTDGRKLAGMAGDVMEIPRGTIVKYFGTHAKLFFVVTPSVEMKSSVD